MCDITEIQWCFCVYGEFMRYKRYSTANDVMKEVLIYELELTNMGFPILSPVQTYPKETIDFRSGLSRNFKNHYNTNCNFYIDDEKFLALENSPDRYLDHLKCFESLCDGTSAAVK